MLDDVEFQPDDYLPPVASAGFNVPPNTNPMVSDTESQNADFILSHGPAPLPGGGCPLEEIPPDIFLVETETEMKPDGTRKIVTRNYSAAAYMEKLQSEKESYGLAKLGDAISKSCETDVQLEQMKLQQQQQEAVNQQLRNQNLMMQQQLAMTLGALQYYFNNPQQGPMLGYTGQSQPEQLRLVGPSAPQEQQLTLGAPPAFGGDVQDVEYVVRDENDNVIQKHVPNSDDIDFGEIEKYM